MARGSGHMRTTGSSQSERFEAPTWVPDAAAHTPLVEVEAAAALHHTGFATVAVSGAGATECSQDLQG